MPETTTPTPPEPKDISDQLSDIWANMKALTGVSEVEKLMKSPQQWLTDQPVIKGLLNHPEAKSILSWMEKAENVKMFPALISQCGIAFLETSHGINRAYNSKAHANLAGAGESALSSVVSTSTEKGIYGDAVNAFNDSLNLPELSKTGVKITQDMSAAWGSIQTTKDATLNKSRKVRDDYFKQLESKEIVGKVRRAIRSKYDLISKSLIGMGDKPIPAPIKGGVKPPKSPTPTPTPTPTPGGGGGIKTPNQGFNQGFNPGFGLIIGHNPYDINSIYNARISSIRSIQVNASALVVVPIVAPIVAVGGAIATVGITAGIISTIASWFLNSAMSLAGMPAALIPAITHCVTAIVLKVSGSSGAEALRYFAASALKANSNLLMSIFGTTNMNVTGWMFLTAMAVPILLVSIIIILAMRTKNKVTFSHFYLLAEHDKYPGFAYASIQNADDAIIEFDKMKKDLLALATVTYSDIHGVGINLEEKNPKVKGGYKLTTDVPSKMTTDDAKKVLEVFSEKHSLSIPLGSWKPI